MNINLQINVNIYNYLCFIIFLLVFISAIHAILILSIYVLFEPCYSYLYIYIFIEQFINIFVSRLEQKNRYDILNYT